MASIQLSVSGYIEIQARLAQVPPTAIRAAMEAMDAIDLELARYIVFHQLGGAVLHWRTGQLADSIKPVPAVAAGGVVTGGVEQQDSRAPYGKAHEYGAYIPEREGNPVLAWTSPAGTPVFARRARAFQLPERSFMRTAEEEFEPIYQERTAIAVKEALIAADMEML